MCENDLIEIRFEAKTGLMGYRNKIPFNVKIVDVFYFKEKQKIYGVGRDGNVREIETEGFTMIR